MGAVIGAEWRRGVRSWRLWIAVAVTIAILLFSAFQFAYPPVPNHVPRFINFFSVSIEAMGGYLTALWPVLIPVVVTLPAGDTLAIDRRRGVDATMITRVGWARYLWGKVVGTVLLTALAVGIAIILVEAYFWATFPAALPPLLRWNVDVNIPYQQRIHGVFGVLYLIKFDPHYFWSHAVVYVMLVVLMALWASVALASLSVAAAVWIRQPLLTMAVPVMVFFLGDIVAESMWAGHLVPSVFAGAYLWSIPSAGSWGAIALYWAVLALVPTVVVTWLLLVRKEWPRSVG